MVRNVDFSAHNKRSVATQFSASKFIGRDYVAGQTFARWWVRNDLLPDDAVLTAGASYFLVYKVSAKQAHGQCDKCVSVHMPTNVACTMNQSAGESEFIDDSFLYDVKTHVKFVAEIYERMPSNGSVSGVIATLTKL
jgi:hypothetical protein